MGLNGDVPSESLGWMGCFCLNKYGTLLSALPPSDMTNGSQSCQQNGHFERWGEEINKAGDKNTLVPFVSLLSTWLSAEERCGLISEGETMSNEDTSHLSLNVHIRK